MLFIGYSETELPLNRSKDFFISIARVCQMNSRMIFIISYLKKTINIITRMVSCWKDNLFIYKHFIMNITNLKNVIVDKISLVSKSENPAVPKASTKFAIFKTQKKYWSVERLDTVMQKLQYHKELQKTSKIDWIISKLSVNSEMTL